MKILPIIAMSAVLLVSGCSFVDIDVRGTEVAHSYEKDINEAERYNPGSDYFMKTLGDVDPRILYVDYGVQSLPFVATYTLPTEQKISIVVEAEILFRLKKNPKDTNNNMSYSEDEYVQYFSTSVSPLADGSRDYALKVAPLTLWNKLMSEPTDLAFRSVFTDANTYNSFDSVESSIVEIQKSIKEELVQQALLHKIEVVGIKIKDIPVPTEIATARGKNLQLSQEAINQVQELKILARNAGMQMAVDVRYAMNNVIVDNLVSSQIDKGYMFMETLRKGVDKGNAMEINITPDFMRYLEKGDTGQKASSAEVKKSDDLFNKLNSMTDAQLMEHFTKGE
jgi:hypothetical protein